MTKTDNPLDVAILGRWLVRVPGPERSHLHAGWPLQDERERRSSHRRRLSGSRCRRRAHCPRPDGGIADRRTGRHGHAGNEAGGAIGVFNLRSESKLTRFGNSGVLSSIPGDVVQDFTSNGVQQGFSEGSNVNPVLEMTKMIAVQRSFDSAATTIQESEFDLHGCHPDPWAELLMAVMNALQKLEQFVLTETAVQRRVRISGTIREISPSYYRVAGLSQFVRLGDRVGFSAQDRTQIGEVVRIDEAASRSNPSMAGSMQRSACLLSSSAIWVSVPIRVGKDVSSMRSASRSMASDPSCLGIIRYRTMLSRLWR